MNLNVSEWKPFLIGRIFTVKYGVNLELDSLNEASEKGSVNFVSRCISNNGVSAKVEPISGVEPQAAGIISVAGGGSSVLSTYVQEEPFYSGRDLYLLIPKIELSKETKMFITTIIEKNKYRYSFGRQANKTLSFLEILLPVKYMGANPAIDTNHEFSDEGYIPDWHFMENYIKSLRYKPLTTANHDTNISLQGLDWEEFAIPSLFIVDVGKYYYPDQYSEGQVPYISASDTDNGVGAKINLHPDFTAGKITIGKIGATAYLQSQDFCATSDVNVLTPRVEMNKYHLLFITSIINFSENYKWSYGRQCRKGDTEGIIIKLPVKCDHNGIPIIDEDKQFSNQGYIPDWDYMENYIKNLPYGDRI